ncbi:hypothetical protein PGT21_008086 [Puccinia graminis f. sp. tritici]|uniref:Uncharacterized protein n=1 Tax=Puccinia graminis f. sp. tritici TaxID=56615 RepID=A0A5B0LJQ4_PUCGR|nr:hypothetical protein PGT21_008086 [Puccinia graminis f. sp. tritici]
MVQLLFCSAQANVAGSISAVQGSREDRVVPPKARVKPTKKKASDVPSDGGFKGGQVQDRMGILDGTHAGSGASSATAVGQSAETQGDTQGENPKKRALESPDEIEVLQGPIRPRVVHGVTYHRAPLGPEPPAMESVNMETYLRVSHVEDTDQATRRRLRANGITHWTFFRRSSEDELVNLGFPLGIARLLCEGVPRLARYVEHRSLPL